MNNLLLKINPKYKGSRIIISNGILVLDDTLTQKQLLHIKNMINSEYVIEVPVKKVNKKKVEEDVKDTEE